MHIPEIPGDRLRIIGLGIDIVASERVRRMLFTFERRFLSRCFTEGEVEYCLSRREVVPELAARLAAKEACFKAIGGRRGMSLGWKDFEVVMDHESIPAIRLRDDAEKRGRALGVGKIWLSLTHEDEWAGAVVIMTT